MAETAVAEEMEEMEEMVEMTEMAVTEGMAKLAGWKTDI